MGAKQAVPKWSDVKKRLQSFGPPEFLELVCEMFKLSVENQTFLVARLLKGTVGTSLLEPYRRRIEQAFYSRNGWPQGKIQLGAARKVIRDYQKATGDLTGTIELMMVFVETGTAFTRNFGDIDAPFYDSLTSVLDEIKRLVTSKEARGLYDHFRQRLLVLVEMAAPIGWGYGDYVGGTVRALECRQPDTARRRNRT